MERLKTGNNGRCRTHQKKRLVNSSPVSATIRKVPNSLRIGYFLFAFMLFLFSFSLASFRPFRPYLSTIYQHPAHYGAFIAWSRAHGHMKSRFYSIYIILYYIILNFINKCPCAPQNPGGVGPQWVQGGHIALYHVPGSAPCAPLEVFPGFFFSCFFLSGPLDQVAPPPGGELNRTPCGGYGEAAGDGVSVPNCPKKEKAPFPKFPEKQKDLSSHH